MDPVSCDTICYNLQGALIFSVSFKTVISRTNKIQTKFKVDGKRIHRYIVTDARYLSTQIASELVVPIGLVK